MIPLIEQDNDDDEEKNDDEEHSRMTREFPVTSKPRLDGKFTRE